MPARKLKPIEERDPYAAAVLDAFDQLESTWQQRHPNENAPDPEIESAAAQGEISRTGPDIGTDQAYPAFAADHPPINLHSHHDFRDNGDPMEKIDPYSWSSWAGRQQREKIPGVG